MVSEPKVRSKIKNDMSEKNGVPTLIDYSHMRTWLGSHVGGCWDSLFHIDKLKMVCTLYKLLKTFFPLSYGFGMVYIPWLMKCVHLVFSPIIANVHNKSSLI